MIKDVGPRYNLGFGTPLQEEPERGTSGGETNAVQKALDGHPVMRFFAVAGASILSAHLAGQVVRSGGIRLASKIQDIAQGGGGNANKAQGAIHTFRRIEAHLDSLQGITRSREYEENPDILVTRIGNKSVREAPETIDNAKIRSSELDRDPELSAWSMRDSLQQKLIAQARRIPYEAPGFYVADKMVLQPLTGADQDPKNKVNWSSPIDVIGDFSYQTLKNLSLNILPFELGTAAGKQAYHSFAMKAVNQPGNNLGYITTRVMLEQLGVDVTNFMDKAIKHSNASFGAFSEMITESASQGKTFEDFVRTQKNAAFTNEVEYKNAGFGRRLFIQARNIANGKDVVSRRTALDTMPGPFRGMGSGVVKFKQTRKELVKVHDDWQDLMMGRTTIGKLRKDDIANKTNRAQSLISYMNKGGGTTLEQHGKASFELGKGGPKLPDGKPNPDWNKGIFFRERSEDAYRGLVVDELAKSTGLKREHLSQFVRQAERISPLPGSRAPQPGGENLINRFKYMSNDFHGDLSRGDYEENLLDWWKNITRGASNHGIDLSGDKLGLEVFKKAISNADNTFRNKTFKAIMSADIETKWHQVYDDILPTYTNQSISTGRKPYELFKGSGLEANKDFLIRKTAKNLGVKMIDPTGAPISATAMKQAIWDKGFNPDDLHRLRGFLVSKKEISNPWNVEGRNILGFKPMTVAEGLNNQYYGHNTPGVQREIKNIVEKKAFGPLVGRGGNANPTMKTNTWDMKIDGVFVGPNGKVMDFGRVKRNFTAAMDRFSQEFQIPLLHIKPFQMAGRSAFQAARNKPSIIYASGDSVQPWTLTDNAEKPDFHLWVKSSGKKTKGHVISFRDGKATQMDGLYRPNTTNVENMLGRYGNVMMGQSDVPSSQMHTKKWKRLFDVNFNQENNLFAGRDSAIGRWWDTLKRKPEGLQNPFRAAERFADPLFDPNTITTFESKGLDNLVKSLRGFRFSTRTLRALADDPDFKYIYDLKDSLGNSVLDMPDSIIPRFVEDVLKKDRSLLGKTPQAVRVKKLQQNLINLVAQGKTQNDFWNLPAHSNVRSSGISTRIDQLRSELYDYLAIRGDITNTGKSTTNFNDTVTKLVNKLDELKKTGSISSAERAEGRAAILSLQVENARNMTFDLTGMQFPVAHSKDTLTKLFSEGVEAKQLLREVGDFAPVHHGRRGFLRRKASDFFAGHAYEKPDQINPLGSDTLFMPTFKTAFDKNPIQATLGVLGMSRRPDAISGLAIPSHHLVERINNYFGTFGLALDPTRYKSPMDEFARGIIGKRVLPIYAAGATALAVDRTAGGMIYEDENGNPVHRPLVLGAAAEVFATGQVALAAAIPGGQTGRQKREELDSGEVPIRTGRYWAMGNTPFKGGRIQNFSPSWLQRIRAGGTYTPEMNETPMERLLFGYDFSPLRPLDPYRREREDSQSRPYPLTGDYFTGPWGPLTPALNNTIGRLLKPRRRMHEEEEKYSLQQYQRVGDAGAYFSPTPIATSGSTESINSHYMAALGGPTSSITPFYGSQGYSHPRGIASSEVRGRQAAMVSMQQQAAGRPGSYVNLWEAMVPYGVPIGRGLSPRVVSAQEPLDYGSVNIASRRLAFTIQEMTGIYGFAAASVRESLGFGDKDLASERAVLEPASRGYSASRSFWNLNLGGAGDLPLPLEGRFSNLEISEIVRRFVPKEPAGMTYVNNIPNLMGQQYPWLPGSDYALANIKSGDPYNAVSNGEIRLPGTGYTRTHTLYPDQYAGQLGLANIHDILGDIAPWSSEFQAIDSAVDKTNLSSPSRAKIEQTRAQVEAMRYKNEFTPYTHRYDSVAQTAAEPTTLMNRTWEWLAHRDTYVNTKLGAPRTAVEDWERDSVYGATFPRWEAPYQSFIKPAINKSTQRDPVSATLAGGAIGFLFGASVRSQKIGSVIGGTIGLAASTFGHAYEAATGDRFIPMDRRKELAAEEYTDILAYTRAVRGASLAQASGDMEAAQYFTQQKSRTMYGANLNSTPEQLALAVPGRKREHFQAMLYAPVEERERILSTAGRLERRLFQAAWGMQVEERPDLNQYFQEHELPPPGAEFWSPEVSMDNIKIKVGQSMGLDMSQMGYYPQQITEANLINPSYPDFNKKTSPFSLRAQLKRLALEMQGRNGGYADVVAMPSAYPGNRVELTAGVYS